MEKLLRFAKLVAAFAGGVLYYVYKGGGPSLAPRNTNWLYTATDWPRNHLAWEWFRREGWHFPPGSFENFPTGAPSSIALHDGIPWVAVFFKLWASILPAHFQYVGLWLGLCFGLQAIFGVKLAELCTRRPWLQLLAASLFVVAPPLLFRAFHEALSAHWGILAMLWIGLRPCPDAAACRRSLVWMAGLLFFFAGVHAYLATMMLALAVGVVFRHWKVDRVLTVRGAALATGALGAITLGTWWMLGYFVGEPLIQSIRYGRCAADILTFINPMARGTLLPDIELPDIRWDGFAYQGAGVLLLALAVGVALVSKRGARPSHAAWRRLWPLLVVCILEGIFALSSKVTFAGWTVLEIAPDVIGRYLGVFQGTGRFVWPLFYLCLAGAVLLAIRLLSDRPAWAYGALALTLAVQVYDQRKTVSTVASAVATVPPIPLLRSEAWRAAAGQYRELVVYPPGLWGCYVEGESFTEAEIYALGYLALDLGAKTNSGFGARADRRERPYCDALTTSLTAQKYDDNAIYVVHAKSRALFAGAACGTLDGRTVCVSPDRHDDFRALLDRQSLDEKP
jgi:hypothetical protein